MIRFQPRPTSAPRSANSGVKYIHNKTILSFEGKEMPIGTSEPTDVVPWGAVHVDTAVAIRLLISAIPTEDFAAVENSLRLMKLARDAGHESTNDILFEDADYKYLMEQHEKHGPRVFRLNAVQIKDAFEDEIEGVNPPDPSRNGEDTESHELEEAQVPDPATRRVLGG